MNGNVCGWVNYTTRVSTHTTDFIYLSGVEKAMYSKDFTQASWEKTRAKMCWK